MAGEGMAWDLDLASLTRLGCPAHWAHYRRGEAGRLSDGIWVVAWVSMDEESVADAAFEVYGSPAALVLADRLARTVAGLSRAQAGATSAREAVEALGLPADAAGEALVIEDALARALAGETSGGSNEH